ncbi:DNA-3-methyladenine glycosylase [Pontixanthobacter gangjinensis]|uniref:DNA-3-methyladenine glycosylase II n=1 Tax=Pontixanthobacter gangjinensis TaxID=1028742 RepID=A0A6I4SL93_9SPHN|nr:DNA-3-methyladenine glycosylase 2 family protein [Pontixanthobacter gangjinensis]MXO56424.1 DNA-3-methyladenine glycosylase 2 family protein [Pontixanthobacter gangjinensis]
MGLTAQQIKHGVDHAVSIEPAFAKGLKAAGYPEPRVRPTGYRTLLRTIVGQQVSVAAAASVWNKLEIELGEGINPDELLSRDHDQLRACGLSRQKQAYARSLCELVVNGELDLTNLPTDDEEAIVELTRIKGIGRWSAEIYLLFAEGRPDIWPAGDLAVQVALHKLLGLPERPTEKEARALSEPYRPHRGALAIFAWHCYDNPAL